MKKIRGSAADRIMLCNYSSIKPDILIDTSGAFSNFGHAGHEVMHKVVFEDLKFLPDISTVVRDYEIEGQERSLRIALYNALREWKEVIRPSIDRDTLITEKHYSRALNDEFEMTGHTDMTAMIANSTTLLINDWKFGEVSEHWNQLKAYAFIMLEYFPQATEVYLCATFARHNEGSKRLFTREEIEGKWREDFIKALKGNSFKPSHDACKYCPVLDCTARQRLEKSTAGSLMEIDESLPISEQMLMKYEDVMLIDKTIGKYKKQVKDYLEITGKEFQLPSGKMIGTEDGHRDKFKFWEGRDVIMEHFDVDDVETLLHMLKDCLVINKTKFMEVVQKHSEYRKGAENKRKIHAELEMANAIITSSFKKIALRKGE